jgi:ABC-type arginine transport system ATPase subunit
MFPAHALNSLILGLESYPIQLSSGQRQRVGLMRARMLDLVLFMLDNTALILEGAIPAAHLALLIQGIFDLADRVLVPRRLRLNSKAASTL